MSIPKKEPVLHIYLEKFIFYDEDGNEFIFEEGKSSKEAKKRLSVVYSRLDEGYFTDLINECRSLRTTPTTLEASHMQALESLVDSVTSEVGRAVVSLTILQLIIKSLDPTQSIRLHKSSTNKGSFSWKEGLPMRTIDAKYVTPILRHYDLIRINKYGIMMTRTLAENYPYSVLYKAAIKGGKKEWLSIVEWVETNKILPEEALKYIIGMLLNKTDEFEKLTKFAIEKVLKYTDENLGFERIFELIKSFITKSDYSARIFEVAIHSFFQVVQHLKLLDGYLKPLSQMRSANKKHGNIGDVEITLTEYSLDKEISFDIVESWDAKYGKTYLREELEELNDKLYFHPQAEVVGFITDGEPNLKTEIVDRVEELMEIHSVKIEIVSFDFWVNAQIIRFNLDQDKFANLWLIALAESLCQKRRGLAPIDEPTEVWVKSLIDSISII